MTVRALSTLETNTPVGTPQGTTAQDLHDIIESAIGVRPYVAKTANYTASDDDETIACDATGGAITITLPAVATTRVGKVYTILKTDTSANAVIVDGNSSETIQGDTTQIIFTQYAFVTILNTGAAWLVIAQRGLYSGVTFIQTQNGAVSNTTSETTIFATGIGTLTLPANFWRAGKSLRITAVGFVNTTGTPTLNLKAKLGSTQVVATGAATMADSLTNVGYRITVEMTCLTVGASGTIMGQAMFLYDNGTAQVEAAVITGAVTVDTTAAQAVSITATWGTANASNTITSSNVFVEILN